MSFNLEKKTVDTVDTLSEFDVLGFDAFDGQDLDEDESSSYVKEKTEKINTAALLTPETIVNNKKLYVALNYADFEKYATANVKYNPLFIEFGKIGYDIETNAEDPKSANAKIVGFSVAFSDKSGIYVVRESLDYKMPEEDWNKIIRLFVRLMQISKHIVVHNRKYENPYTINCLNYEIANDVIEDTMIKCRILFPGESAGLKYAAAKYLGYADWDVELKIYRDAVEAIIENSLMLLEAKRLNEDKQADYELFQSLFVYKAYTTPQEFYQFLHKKTTKHTEYVINFISLFQVLAINDLLNPEIFNLLISSMYEIIQAGGIKTDVIPYSLIPKQIIAKYGAIDAVATFELDDYCNAQFEPKSAEIRNLLHSITGDSTYDFFDLRKGYEIVKAQYDAGINLEMAGAKWDDVLAQKEYDYYNQGAINAWRSLFKNKKFAEYVKASKRPEIISELVANAMKDFVSGVSNPHFQLVKDSLNKLGRHQIQKSQVKFLEVIIDNGQVGSYLTVKFTQLYNDFTESLNLAFDTIFTEIFEREVNKEVTKYTELNDIFNPSSTSGDIYTLINNTLNTDDLKIAKMLIAARQFISDNDIDSLSVTQFKSADLILHFLKNIDIVVETEKAGTLALANKAIFEQFKTLIVNADFSGEGNPMYQILNAGMEFIISKLNEPTMLGLNECFKLMGVDPEDETTWSEDYIFLYNLRYYKKCTKMIGSYIIGDVGRKAVMVVDKNSVSDLLPRRLRSYYSDIPFNPETEEYLFTKKFYECSAETGRWKSGFHTLPAGSTIKNIFRSRYKGGVICAPDYSQMEVRAMAASAKETTLLNAFKNGEDPHKRTAAAVYKKDISDVTDDERKFAKAVTFAILYGGSTESIANNQMHGDLAGATKLVEGFYSGYPKLKSFIDTMHSLWRQTGYIALTSNRLIRVDLPEKKDPKYNGKMSKGYRCSQNYPIQGLSNDVAGYALYLAIQHIKKNNLKSKAFSFVHDALYFDIHPDELFDFTLVIKDIMNKYPLEAFDLPAEADIVVGVSMGQELKAKSISKTSDNTGEMTISGYEDDFDELIAAWKDVYADVTWEELEEPKTRYLPKEELFFPKKPINPYSGMSRRVITRKVKLVFKSAQ